MPIDTGIVTIYDTRNKFAPMICHRIDAKEFLSRCPGRWTTSPTDQGNASIYDATPKDTGEDTGEIMRLKSMTLKSLQGAAKKAGITGHTKMKKADLIGALSE